MVRVYNVSRFSPNTNDTRMTYELFADTKSEVVPGVKVEGLEGTIPAGTKLHTAAGEVARMTSSGNWVWSSNSGSNGEFTVNLHGDDTTYPYVVSDDCTYDDILEAMNEGLNIVANVVIDYTNVPGHQGEKVSISRLQLSCRETYEPGPDDPNKASDVLMFNWMDYLNNNVIGSLMLISGLVWPDTQKLMGVMMPGVDRRLPLATEDDHGKIILVALDGQYILAPKS